MRLIADGVVERDGRRRARRPGRLHPAPPQPAARRRARRRPAGPGPRPPRADRPGPHRDDRDAASPTSPSRPASRASGSSTTRSARSTPRTPDRSCAAGRGSAGVDAGPRSSCGCRCGRRTPGGELLRFLAAHRCRASSAAARTGTPARCALPHGHGHGAARPSPTDPSRAGTAFVRCDARPSRDLRDVGAAVERCRRLLDADCDPVAVGDALAERPAAGRARARSGPGCGCPGSVDGDEIAVRAVLGQQVSLAGAARSAASWSQRYGEPARRARRTTD